jgi:hypothetical protein
MGRLLTVAALVACVAVMACGTGRPSIDGAASAWCTRHDMTPLRGQTDPSGEVDNAVLKTARIQQTIIPAPVDEADANFILTNMGYPTEPPNGWREALDAWRRTVGYAEACTAAYQGKASIPPTPTSSLRLDPTTARSPGPSGARVTMTTPSNWKTIETTEAAIREAITVMGPSNPQLAAQLEGILTSGMYRSFIFFAEGFDGEHSVGNVIVSAYSAAGLSLESFEPALEPRYRQLGMTEIVVSRTALPAGDALVIDGKLPMSYTGAIFDMTERVFTLIRGESAYDIAFSCNPVNPGACLKDADAMARTLVIGP